MNETQCRYAQIKKELLAVVFACKRKTNETMQLLVQQIQSGWPENSLLLPMSLRPYYPYRDELTTQNNLIFKAQNILIPPNLRADTLQKLHQSHQGIEKTKRLARESIFWPGMNSQIKQLVSTYPTCFCIMPIPINGNRFNPTIFRDGPWQKIGTDLFD